MKADNPKAGARQPAEGAKQSRGSAGFTLIELLVVVDRDNQPHPENLGRYRHP